MRGRLSLRGRARTALCAAVGRQGRIGVRMLRTELWWLLMRWGGLLWLLRAVCAAAVELLLLLLLRVDGLAVECLVHLRWLLAREADAKIATVKIVVAETTNKRESKENEHRASRSLAAVCVRAACVSESSDWKSISASTAADTESNRRKACLLALGGMLLPPPAGRGVDVKKNCTTGGLCGVFSSLSLLRSPAPAADNEAAAAAAAELALGVLNSCLISSSVTASARLLTCSTGRGGWMDFAWMPSPPPAAPAPAAPALRLNRWMGECV